MKKYAILLTILGVIVVGCDNKNTPPVPKSMVGNADRSQSNQNTDQDDDDDDDDNSMPQGSMNTMSEQDRMLVNRIREVLQGDQVLSTISATIQIRANHGNVTILGAVSSPQDREMIANKIKRINGVRNLDNQLVTKSQRSYSNQ